MAQVWSTFLRLQPGVTTPERASLGPPTRRGQLEQVGESIAAEVGTLRVGFVGGTYPADRVRCSIWTPDNGIELGRIDVPLVIAVPLPVNISVFALAPPAELVQLVATVSTSVDAAASWGPTQSEFVAVAGVYVLEPWCQAVTVHNPDSRGEWLDAAGASLQEFSLYRPRPRLASAVRVLTEDSTVTQHYAT
jgi:hypothetical protein